MAMKILFYLPRPTVVRCFAPQDIERLQARHELFLPMGDDRLAPGEWSAGGADADVIITGWGTPRLTNAMLEQAPNLKLLAHSAGSTRHLLPESFWGRGIRLATANEALGVGVAETTVAMIVAGLKGFFPCSASTRAGEWRVDFVAGGWPVRELYQTTIGLIGASKVARHVIRLLRSYDVRVLVSDPYLDETAARELGVERISLDELLRQSEVVSLHAPALPETRHMLSRQQFKLMPDRAIFINTARGMIVDEEALCDELRTGRIFAFIDVTDPEPPAADHPFRTLPNVVLTPHIAGAVNNGCLRQGRSIVNQILEFERGDRMHGEVVEKQWRVMA